MHNTIQGLLVLHKLGVSAKPSMTPKIVEVHWCLLYVGWVKVNTDKATSSSPGLGGYGAIFEMSIGFVKESFAIPSDKVFAFEAELYVVIYTAKFASK